MEETKKGSLARIWQDMRGRIIDTDGEGHPVVDFEGNPGPPRVARRTVPLENEQLRTAIASRQQVVLRFEEVDPKRPIIVGLGWGQESTSGVGQQLFDRKSPTGKHVRITQKRNELTVTYGRASIAIRSNGTVAIRATRVQLDEHFHLPESCTLVLN